jgi:hypothetical protein
MTTCDEIYHHASFLIPDLYKSGSTDTLNSLVDYWNNRCSDSESVLRVRILLAIENNSFSEDLYNESITGQLKQYKFNVSYTEMVEKKGTIDSLLYPNYLEMINDYRRLLFFTIGLAEKLLLTKENLTDIERFFLEFYSNSVKSIKKKYLPKVSRPGIFDFYDVQHKKPYLHTYLILGTWIPTGNFSIVGVQGSVGAAFGFGFRTFYVDLAVIGKPVFSPKPYEVNVNGVTINTNKFVGIYVGADFGYRLFTFSKSGFDLLGGVAYDGFQALNTKYEIKEIGGYSKRVNSLNLNLGLGYRILINKRGSFIGLDLKYNFVDYNNVGGSDLSGNIISIQLLYGLSNIGYR